jgi:hypothetical protein
MSARMSRQPPWGLRAEGRCARSNRVDGLTLAVRLSEGSGVAARTYAMCMMLRRSLPFSISILRQLLLSFMVIQRRSSFR